MEQIAYIAMILLIGTLCSVFAYWLKVSNLFFLILAGMVLGGFGLIEIPQVATETLAILALAMIVFDSTRKLKFREVREFSLTALKLSFVFLFFDLVLLSFATYALFRMKFMHVLLFASIMYDIDPGVALSVLGKTKKKVTEILEIESIINTPLTVILPLMLLKLIEANESFTAANIPANILATLQQIGLGLAIGIAIGYMITYIMKNTYLGDLSHVALLTSAVIAFVMAELIGGSGILSVTVFGLMFGNLHVAHEMNLKQSASIFAYTLEILVFILMGTILVVEPQYILKGTVLFMIYLGIRFLSVEVSFPHFHFKEKLFMTLNVPKGIDVVVLILLITSEFMDIEGIRPIVNLSLLFVLYSIVLSTLTTTFTPNLLSIQKHKQA